MTVSIRASWFVGGLAVLALGCGPGTSTVGGGTTNIYVTGGGGSSGTDGGGGGGGGGGGSSAIPCTDEDADTFFGTGDCTGSTAATFDCNDTNKDIHPGATETQNTKDDDCDGIVDNHIAGADHDQDGTPYPQDCNDDGPLVGPNGIEVAGDSVDNNCNGQIDEAPPADCDGQATGSTAADFAKAIGICPLATGTEVLTASTFTAGNAAARNIRPKFGSYWTPKQGGKMVLVSSGKALDLIDDGAYSPGSDLTTKKGMDFGVSSAHPLYSAPRCGTPMSSPYIAKDLNELKLTLKVPQNANSFSFQFNFFSAEYPEFVCTRYNDRFIVVLESKAIDKTKLPNAGVGQCVTGTATPTCNISYDSSGQPVTINNGFFDVCVAASGTGWSNACTKSPSMLAATGYDVADATYSAPTRIIGGATGWLTTKAPVSPGETITLRFIVFDEGDGILDSAALIDNFQWTATAVTAPVTDPGIN